MGQPSRGMDFEQCPMRPGGLQQRSWDPPIAIYYAVLVSIAKISTYFAEQKKPNQETSVGR